MGTGPLILMFFGNASMNLIGLLMEKMTPPGRIRVDWTPFVFGSIAGVAPWIVVLSYFLGGQLWTDSRLRVRNLVRLFLVLQHFSCEHGPAVRQSWQVGRL